MSTQRASTRTLAAARSGLPLGALVGATALVALGSPTLLRMLVALPVLVLVAGTSTTRLLLGPRVPGAPPPGLQADADGTPGGVVGTTRDGVLRGSLAVVFGVLVLLASLLLTQLVGVPIAGSSVLVGFVGVAAVLLVAGRLRPAGVGVPGGPLRGRPWWRPALGVTATAAVLAGAVALAASLPDPVVERYTLLAFTGAQPYSSRSPAAAPRADVTLDVRLSSFGETLPAADPSVRVHVAGASADDLRVSWSAVEPGPATEDAADPGVSDQRTGTVTFRAPRDPGLYPVEIRAGTSDADQLLLTTSLQVTS